MKKDSPHAALRIWLRSRGMTNIDLAKHCRISKGAVDSWLCGRRTPSIAMRLRIEELTKGAIEPLQWATEAEIEEARARILAFEMGEHPKNGYLNQQDRALMRAYVLLGQAIPRSVIENARRASERREDDRVFLADQELIEQSATRKKRDVSDILATHPNQERRKR